MTDHITAAYERGREAAENAASWGNYVTRARARRILAMLRAGDPEAYDYLPVPPDLSGQWAGDPTPASLASSVIGADDADDGTIDALADAFERGVSDHFEPACERALIEATR